MKPATTRRAWINYGLLGLAAYVIFLLATVPAARVYPLLQTRLAPLTLYGLEGTLWQGRARTADIGAYRVGPFSWELHIGKLLLGRVEAEVGFRGNGEGEAVIARTLGGEFRVRVANANVPVAETAAWLPPLVVSGGGHLVIRQADMVLHGGRISAAQGSVLWREGVTPPQQSAPLGDLAMHFDTRDGVIKGTLLDKGGPVQAQGVLTLKADGAYQFSGTLGARDATLAPALQAFGPAGADGKITLSYQGRYP
ncbi:MAG: type II secretion system protein N [Gammaproteobacteria bacterium]|nr:type II secretion system protein N [Gammaproteobacteria bacterium]